MLDSAFVHHPHMSKYLDEDFLFSHSSKTPETCWANMKRHRSAISGTALSMLHIDFLKTLIAVKNSRGDFLAVKGSFVLVMPDWKMKCSWELVCREFFTGIETNWFSDVPVFPFQLKKISYDWCTDARTHTQAWLDFNGHISRFSGICFRKVWQLRLARGKICLPEGFWKETLIIPI